MYRYRSRRAWGHSGLATFLCSYIDPPRESLPSVQLIITGDIRAPALFHLGFIASGTGLVKEQSPIHEIVR